MDEDDDYYEGEEDLSFYRNNPASSTALFEPRFIGLPELRGVLRKHEQTALARLQAVVSNRSLITKRRFQDEMNNEYTSETATGRLADSITYRTLKRPGGVESRFYIKPYRELEFVTSLMGGYFNIFPVTPFPIFPASEGQSLWIHRSLRGGGRVAVRKIPPGQPVLWGKFTGGFSRDVLKDVSEEEAQFFLEDVYSAMKDELSEMRTSVRRRKSS